ncbi:MAG TPA: hypothetical protein VGO43_13300 [Pyrinomonadaceae bacterium]|jgi:uncharacterized protein YjbJ (UPF0337 family)|nr:hypothetical protein [Pyrinomonadaceae bacterium]
MGPNDNDKDTLTDHISGLGQKIIGEVETIGGILTGDPTTQAEGEFNVEVGDIRDDLEGEIDSEAADQ